MATLSSRRFTYHVFLSFRGEDTRYGFTGYLYKALWDRGIHTFMDDDKLQSGEEITPALQKAIQESRIAIVVLSHNYASSSFCLDELATILDCQSEGLLVIPVFYKVDPSNVRHQNDSYKEALAKHQERFKGQEEKLNKWKMALRQVVDLCGYHFEDGNDYKYKFIGSIVERVSRVINRVPLKVPDYLVGLPSQELKVKKLLDLGSNAVVHMIGIHGMGGLGKTTLSLVVYNSIADNFDCSCFLHIVRKKSNKDRLEDLQSILLSKMVIEENIMLTSWQEGASMIQQRLGRKKVLLILDNVDNRKQLEAFAGRADWFGPGSRVIITTRDEQLLKSHQIERTYKMEELNDNDSLQLLKWNAFKREKVDPSYEDVLKRVVTYASGLPLALKVIGSNLYNKSVEEWESAIEHYERIPNDEILQILKVSYVALGEEEKSVFLDIACFFNESSLEEVEGILRVLYGNNMKHHIGVLLDKSLIDFWSDDEDCIVMHDLIEDMGTHIDQQESPKEPGKRRRLWSEEDILHVLKNDKGTSKTEIIILDSEQEKTLEWNPNAFRRMKNLKILIIRNGKFSKGPNYFPESLRLLEWHGYPSNSLPSNFDPSNLVTCMLPNSHFTSFEFLGSSKKFENLSVLNFDWCKFLTHIPDMSDFVNLEEVSFKGCESLVAVHDSIGFMSKLKILNAECCIKLMSFPPLNLPTLERLQLSDCSSLEKFPEILGKMENIKGFELAGLPIKELPLSFQNLIGLEELSLSCKIVHLRSSIFTMPNLIYFIVTDCMEWKWVKSDDAEDNLGSTVPSKLEVFSAPSCNLDDNFFSAGFMQLAQVRSLILQNNNFKNLPECIKEFHNLKHLDVTHCKHLEEIRGFPPKLEYFSAPNCISLSSTSLDMLLNKELYEVRKATNFKFPGESFPEWFDLKSSGPSCSFWFRNKFPARVLSLLIIHMNKYENLSIFDPEVCINGKWQTGGGHYLLEETKFEFDQTYLCDLKMYGNFFKQPFEKEWNHVKVTYSTPTGKSWIKATGIHVFKEENNIMEDIRFDDPYIMEEEEKEEEKEEGEEEEEEKEEKAEEENSIMEDTMEEEGRRGKRRKLHHGRHSWFDDPYTNKKRKKGKEKRNKKKKKNNMQKKKKIASWKTLHLMLYHGRHHGRREKKKEENNIMKDTMEEEGRRGKRRKQQHGSHSV